jgi:excisionase family DNA binding protein
MDEPEFLTVSQAAEAFSATSQTIRNWIRENRLQARRIGNRFLIPREEVERLRGDLPAQSGESPWDYAADRPPDPLPRKAAESEPAADPAEGLLGA